MLTITIPGFDGFDEETDSFVTVGDTVLDLEHSLLSLSKWEELWEKPFLGSGEKTTEETLGYVEAMTLTPGVSPDVYRRLTDDNMTALNNYIQAKRTATWFKENRNQAPNRAVITSELIYYWMISLEIPFECETWHLNKLFTLIKVMHEKKSPPKKMNRQEALAQRRLLNEQRRAQAQSAG